MMLEVQALARGNRKGRGTAVVYEAKNYFLECEWVEQ
jgi:hypothetical protein